VFARCIPASPRACGSKFLPGVRLVERHWSDRRSVCPRGPAVRAALAAHRLLTTSGSPFNPADISVYGSWRHLFAPSGKRLSVPRGRTARSAASAGPANATCSDTHRTTTNLLLIGAAGSPQRPYLVAHAGPRKGTAVASRRGLQRQQRRTGRCQATPSMIPACCCNRDSCCAPQVPVLMKGSRRSLFKAAKLTPTAFPSRERARRLWH